MHGLNEEFRWLVDAQRVNISTLDDQKRNALHLCIKHNQTNFLFFLCSTNVWIPQVTAMVNKVDASGMNVLHHLVMSGNEQMMHIFTSVDCLLSSACLEVCKEPRMLDKDTPTERQEFSHLHAWRDDKGRTAHDIARTLKRVGMITRLDNLVYQTHVHRMFGYLAESVTAELYKLLLDEFTAFIVENKIAPRVSQLLEVNKTYMRVLAFDIAQTSVCDHALRWLSDVWGLDLKAVHLTDMHSHADYERNVITQVVRGPLSQHFRVSDPISCFDKKETLTRDDLSTKLSHTLQSLASDWDGVQDFAEYVVSQRGKEYKSPKEPLVHNLKYIYSNATEALSSCDFEFASGGEGKRHEMCYAYIEQQLDRMLDVTADERIHTLRWMVRDLRIPLPSPHLFVKWDQFRLLRWACEEGLVDLSAPLKNASPDLLSFAQTLDWI
eukprot:gene27141-33824_t